MVKSNEIVHRPRAAHGLALLVFAVAAAGEQADREESESEPVYSDIAVGSSVTLLGAITFQMSLFYLTNWPDEDIRRYAYEIINATVSIFCAVLIFAICNDLIEEMFLEGASYSTTVAVHFSHWFAWYAILQFFLAWMSGAIGVWWIKNKKGDPLPTDQVELNMKSFTLLLAHLTGFAAINAWGSIQQLYSMRPGLDWIVPGVIPLSMIWLTVMQLAMRRVRLCISNWDDGEVDEHEELWEEVTAEGETDVTGLTVSFLSVQCIRMYITGRLPNAEGEEDWYHLRRHGSRAVLAVFGSGLFALALMVAAYMATEEEKEAVEREEKLPEGKRTSKLSRMSTKKKFGRAVRKCWNIWKNPESEDIVISLSMCFAWCSFFCSQMLLASVISDKALLAVSLATFISFVSFSLIWVLDKLADADWTGELVDSAIKQVIKAIAILVGFAWEQCFDQAVICLAFRANEEMNVSQTGTKFVIAAFCVTIILPAWRLYLLPMTIKNGWKFGFYIDHHDHNTLHKVMLDIQQQRREAILKKETTEADIDRVLEQLVNGDSPKAEGKETRRTRSRMDGEPETRRSTSMTAKRSTCMTARSVSFSEDPSGTVGRSSTLVAEDHSDRAALQQEPHQSQEGDLHSLCLYYALPGDSPRPASSKKEDMAELQKTNALLKKTLREALVTMRDLQDAECRRTEGYSVLKTFMERQLSPRCSPASGSSRRTRFEGI